MMVDHEEQAGNELEESDFKGDLKTCQLKKGLTDAEILAQAVLFLSAGYETTQSALTFVGYNLALNPDIQQKLIKEIDAAHEKHVCDKQNLTFIIQENFYLRAKSIMR
jgi:cytochrome P450 family 3 subfamily A